MADDGGGRDSHDGLMVWKERGMGERWSRVEGYVGGDIYTVG